MRRRLLEVLPHSLQTQARIVLHLLEAVEQHGFFFRAGSTARRVAFHRPVWVALWKNRTPHTHSAILPAVRVCADKMPATARSLLQLVLFPLVDGLAIIGLTPELSVPHAVQSPAARALDKMDWPEEFPYAKADLTPEWSGNDRLFYLLPRFSHHAGEECRESLSEFYDCILPKKGGDVLDLCSSFTSHYPSGWRGKRMVALGLNALELLANPSKTETVVRDLNVEPTLPFADESFDCITNSLSVDYLTQPLDVFEEMHRCLRPGGIAACAFTNRCFPTKVVPIWLKTSREMAEVHHAQVVASYFQYSAPWSGGIAVVDVSPDGWAGQRDPCVVVVARK